jgi:hypothetical protein
MNSPEARGRKPEDGGRGLKAGHSLHFTQQRRIPVLWPLISGLCYPASGLRPLISGLRPPSSGIRPLSSILRSPVLCPPASGPPASFFRPPSSDLRPPASAPPASGPPPSLLPPEPKLPAPALQLVALLPTLARTPHPLPRFAQHTESSPRKLDPACRHRQCFRQKPSPQPQTFGVLPTKDQEIPETEQAHPKTLKSPLRVFVPSWLNPLS